MRVCGSVLELGYQSFGRSRPRAWLSRPLQPMCNPCRFTCSRSLRDSLFTRFPLGDPYLSCPKLLSITISLLSPRPFAERGFVRAGVLLLPDVPFVSRSGEAGAAKTRAANASSRLASTFPLAVVLGFLKISAAHRPSHPFHFPMSIPSHFPLSYLVRQRSTSWMPK